MKSEDKSTHNNTFYSFGGKFTNIKEHISSREKCQVLNETIRDVKDLTKQKNSILVPGPNTIMNDYTKNISQSIFTPGVHKDVRVSTRFSKSKEILKNIVDN